MKLSIIIPTIGRPTLEKVLQGIERCDGYDEIQPEVIVVFNSDASDTNVGFLKFESEVDTTHFKVFRSEKHGVSTARNLGMDKSTGEIIAFLGDDTIPEKEWLRKVRDFHVRFPSQKIALLGRISWVRELGADPFHQWLQNHAQFDFENIQKRGATWQHFYTSNVSVKRSLIISERFDEDFVGWGFEDTELAYRLSKRGMKIIYDSECEVFHDHPQTLASIVANTKNARHNAERFEALHPELSILPRGMKLLALRGVIWVLEFLIPLKPDLAWWTAWKRAWIGDF